MQFFVDFYFLQLVEVVANSTYLLIFYSFPEISIILINFQPTTLNPLVINTILLTWKQNYEHNSQNNTRNGSDTFLLNQ